MPNVALLTASPMPLNKSVHTLVHCVSCNENMPLGAQPSPRKVSPPPVVVLKSMRGVRVQPPRETTAVEWTRPKHVPDVRARKVIVAAFGKPNYESLRVLGSTMPRGSTMTVISEEKVDIPRGHFDVKWVRGHPASASVLQKAGAASADSFLVAGIEDWDDTEADIQARAKRCRLSDLSECMPMRWWWPHALVVR